MNNFPSRCPIEPNEVSFELSELDWSFSKEKSPKPPDPPPWGPFWPPKISKNWITFCQNVRLSLMRCHLNFLSKTELLAKTFFFSPPPDPAWGPFWPPKMSKNYTKPAWLINFTAFWPNEGLNLNNFPPNNMFNQNEVSFGLRFRN